MTELHLPDGGRAARLLGRLDCAWLQFVGGLPARLQDLARRASTFQGTVAGSELFRGPSAMNPGLTCSPWLFWEVVQALDDGEILPLAFGGSLVVLASVLLDHLVDGQSESAGETALLHQALHEGGAARLRACLPCDGLFWREFERLGAEHVVGLAVERESQLTPEQFSFERFLSFVPAKFSPIAVTMAAFAHAVSRPAWLEPIEASIKHLAVASQLLDDVGDWEQDLEQCHLTYYLARMAPADVWRGQPWPSRDEIQQRIDAAWADIDALETVQNWLDRSLHAVADLECQGWKDYVRSYQVLAGQHLVRFKARHLLRAVEPLLGDVAG